MSRLLNWDDEHCPTGHKWVFCPTSTLYSDFYYCPVEDKMWEPTVRLIDEKLLKKEFNTDRVQEMKDYAERNIALEKLRYIPFKKVVGFVNSLENEKQTNQ